MKRIGLIGGMSPESTIEYYRIINREYNAILGRHHSANLVLSSVDFQNIAFGMHNSDWLSVERILLLALRDLESAKVDIGLICCNSAHKVFDAVQKKTSVHILHILEPIVSILQAKKTQLVGILGNKFTMQGHFYHDYLLNNAGIVGVSPILEDQEEIHRIIYKELCYGIVKKESKKNIFKIIDGLRQRGAEGVILGCTELMLLVSDEDTALPIYDSTTLHAKAAVHYVLDEKFFDSHSDDKQTQKI